MSWLRNKIPFQRAATTSKISSSSSKNKSTADAESATGTSEAIQSIAKILIIGETGSGKLAAYLCCFKIQRKSTFINYLTNYFFGGTYDHPRIAIPTRYYTKITESFGHCEKAIDDVTISKTDACHQYLFHDPKTDKQYLFLDTPGLGDTRGAQQDQTNIETILNAINNLQGLTGVILVVNGSAARVTTNFKSVLLGLRGNLPDIVMDNVILILSHAKRHQSTFDIKKTLKMNGTNVYPYYMQNSAFAQDPTKWDSHEHESIERDWVESMEEIGQMLSIINTFQTKSVAAFDDMRTIRNAIKTCMHEARLEITKVQQMHDEILAYEKAVQKYQGEEISYRDYTQKQTVTVNELVDAPYHSTLCSTCNFVCHQQCSLNETQEIGNQVFQNCAAMNSENNCKHCPHNCSYVNHYHARKTMKTSEQTLRTVLHDIKAKFDIATKNKSDFEQKLNSAQDTRKLIEQILKQKIDAVQMQCRELRKVCGSFNLAQELHILVEQLRIEAQTLTSLEARRKAEMVIRELNTFCQNLEAEEQNTSTSKREMIVIDTGSGTNKTTAKFISSTQNKVQESTDKVAAVERILEAQLKNKKSPVIITHQNDSTVYEPIEGENQEESHMQNRRPFSHSQQKSTGPRSQQLPELPKRLPVAAVERMLEGQLKKKKSPVTTTNPNDSTVYEHIEEENQEESYMHNSRSFPHSQRKSTGPRSQQLSTSDSDYGKIYRTEPPTSKATAPKYELMTIKELIDRFHTAISQNRSKAAIERELRNRAQGITCPMITASDRAMFARYTNKYSRMEPGDISYQYMRLQRQVNSRLGDDDMNIEKITTIPSELLVELAALYTLFSSTDTAATDSNSGGDQYNNYNRLSPPSISGTTQLRRSEESASGDLDNRQTRSESYTKENMSEPPSYDDVFDTRNEPLSRTQSSSPKMNEQTQTRERPVGFKSYDYGARPSLNNNDDRCRTNSELDFETMTNDRLVEFYSHARKLDDIVQQVAIYKQLEKRCNGEDSQLMTHPMMKQTLATYRQLETSVLGDKLNAIKREIRMLTNGGDATQIKNVPKYILVKITAITLLLGDRPPDDSYF